MNSTDTSAICPACDGRGVLDSSTFRKDFPQYVGEDGPTSQGYVTPAEKARRHALAEKQERLAREENRRIYAAWQRTQPREVFTRIVCSGCFGLGGGPHLDELQREVFQAEFLLDRRSNAHAFIYCEGCRRQHLATETLFPYLNAEQTFRDIFLCQRPECRAEYESYPGWIPKPPESMFDSFRGSKLIHPPSARIPSSPPDIPPGRLCRKCGIGDVEKLRETCVLDVDGALIALPELVCPTCASREVSRHHVTLHKFLNTSGDFSQRIRLAMFGKFLVFALELPQTPLAQATGVDQVSWDQQGTIQPARPPERNLPPRSDLKVIREQIQNLKSSRESFLKMASPREVAAAEAFSEAIEKVRKFGSTDG